jgi:hypothetical protein
MDLGVFTENNYTVHIQGILEDLTPKCSMLIISASRADPPGIRTHVLLIKNKTPD